MNKFDALEKKLNIASSLIEELDFDDYEVVLPEITNPQTQNNLPAIIEECTNEVFSLDTLRGDFVIIRQNILKLISTGQRVLDSTSIIDPSDMKAAQLTAISELQKTLGTNLQLLVSVYKEIAGIEKTRATTQSKTSDPQAGMVNNGSVTNNNIVYSGDTSQLLDFIKEQTNTNN